MPYDSYRLPHRRRELPPIWRERVPFSLDGTWLASADSDGTVKL